MLLLFVSVTLLPDPRGRVFIVGTLSGQRSPNGSRLTSLTLRKVLASGETLQKGENKLGFTPGDIEYVTLWVYVFFRNALSHIHT